MTAMNIEIWTGIMVGLCIGLTIISILCALLGFFAYSKVVGFEKSTHKIEYMNPFDQEEKDVEEDFDPFTPIPTEAKVDVQDDLDDLILKAKKEKRTFDVDARKSFLGEGE